jgi:hypothetical protein
MNNNNYEAQFKKMVAEADEKTTLIFGAITPEIPYPQVGVQGNAFEAMVIIASLIGRLAVHINASEEGVIGTIYEMIQDAKEGRENSKGKKQ